MRSAYILLSALQLLFIRVISFRFIASFFRSPSPACIYVTPGLCPIDMVFLARGNGPEYASCRPLFGLPMAMR